MKMKVFWSQVQQEATLSSGTLTVSDHPIKQSNLIGKLSIKNALV